MDGIYQHHIMIPTHNIEDLNRYRLTLRVAALLTVVMIVAIVAVIIGAGSRDWARNCGSVTITDRHTVHVSSASCPADVLPDWTRYAVWECPLESVAMPDHPGGEIAVDGEQCRLLYVMYFGVR